MPNWCRTSITFYSKHYQAIKNLSDMVIELKSNPSRRPNGFGNMWLGNLLDYCGINTEGQKCRGSIAAFSKPSKKGSNWIFTLTQVDAWAPNIEIWREIQQTDERFKDIRFEFEAFEPSLNLFWTSDASGQFYPTRYLLIARIVGKNKKVEEISAAFSSQKELMEYFKMLSGGKSFQSIEAAKKYFQEASRATQNEENTFFSLYESRIVDKER